VPCVRADCARSSSAGRGSSGDHRQLRRGPADGRPHIPGGNPQPAAGPHHGGDRGPGRADGHHQPVTTASGRAGGLDHLRCGQDQLIVCCARRSGRTSWPTSRSVLCSPAARFHHPGGTPPVRSRIVHCRRFSVADTPITPICSRPATCATAGYVASERRDGLRRLCGVVPASPTPRSGPAARRAGAARAVLAGGFSTQVA